MFLVRLIILLGAFAGLAYFGHLSLAIKIFGLGFLHYIISFLYSTFAIPVFFLLGLSDFKKAGRYAISIIIYGIMLYLILKDFHLIKI